MKFSRLARSAALAAAGLLLSSGLIGVPTPAWAAPPAPSAASAQAANCHPGTPAAAPATTDFYDPAHPEFGPAQLPDTPPVGPLLTGYHRFGQLDEDQFAAKYRSDGSWIYPPDDGFLTIFGIRISYPQAMKPGSEIDRFGYSGGSYLSPAGTPFKQRALPPQNLNTPTGTPQSNYHLYCVVKSFRVLAGPIAPWFEQPGFGVQFKLDKTLLPEAGSALSVTWLLSHGYLVEENPTA